MKKSTTIYYVLVTICISLPSSNGESHNIKQLTPRKFDSINEAELNFFENIFNYLDNKFESINQILSTINSTIDEFKFEINNLKLPILQSFLTKGMYSDLEKSNGKS